MSDTAVFLRIDGNDNRQPSLIAANVITLVGAIMTIGLRFLSRKISKTRLGLDDWLVVPALICALVYFGNMCGSLSYGFGKYIGGVSFAKLRQAFIGIFVGELFYAYSLVFTKFSLLALYFRLFDQRWARLYCWVLVFINGAWMLAATILACLQCQPTNGFWDRNIPAKCDLDIKASFLALGVVTILTDVALVALPTYICWKLSLSNIKRILLCCVFATGLFVTIASGVRLKAVLSLDVGLSLEALNITYTFSDTALWSGVEANMAIVSSCLPVLRPLVAKAVPESMVPAKLRRPSQPTSYYGFWSTSRKPSQGAVACSHAEQQAITERPDLEMQRDMACSQSPDSAIVNAGASEEGCHELQTEKVSTPPTPPPKDAAPVMKATLTRPPSWDMEVAFTEANIVRMEKGSSDTLRQTT